MLLFLTLPENLQLLVRKDAGFFAIFDVMIVAIGGVRKDLSSLQAVVGLGFDDGYQGGGITFGGDVGDEDAGDFQQHGAASRFVLFGGIVRADAREIGIGGGQFRRMSAK